MFEYAVRHKVRFPYKGSISVEELWDLPVKELDVVFKTLNGKLKQASEDSLLATKSKEEELLQKQIEIVKYIFNTKSEEANERAAEVARREQRQKIMGIMANKQDEALRNMSMEELEAELAKI